MSKIAKLKFPLVIACFLAFIILCRTNKAVSDAYMTEIYPVTASVLSFFSSKIPFSIFDLSTALCIAALFAAVIAVVIGKLKFARFVKSTLKILSIIIVWFYMSWGISYFGSDFYERTGTEKAVFAGINFDSFLDDYIMKLNSAYVEDFVYDQKSVDDEIERMYGELRQTLKTNYPCGKRRIKKPIFENFVTKIGVSGYFGMFFNEIHVNTYALPVERPFIVAHEKAHQFGISGEDECNLYAYVVCTSSDDKYVRYSGYFGALGYVLQSVYRLMPDEYLDRASKINEGVINDYRESYEHWQTAVDPKMSEAQRKIYDAYLKTNKIESGFENYSEMVALLVSWHNRASSKINE